MEKLLLVDFENVQHVDLSRLDDKFRVTIFVGASQKSVPIELAKNLQNFGNRVDWQKVEGNGSNALDFFIACQLGRVLEMSPQLHCIVLSKDKGFDPLLRHLSKYRFVGGSFCLYQQVHGCECDQFNPRTDRVRV